jgi:hypothetical protein
MIRFAAFVVAALAWCSFNIFPALLTSSIPGEGAVMLTGIGLLFGVPTLVYAAIADGLAPIFFPRPPVVGFLILALCGIAAFLAFIQFGGGAPDNKRAALAQIIPGFGLPTLAVIATYMVAGAIRVRRRRAGCQSVPPSAGN